VVSEIINGRDFNRPGTSPVRCHHLSSQSQPSQAQATTNPFPSGPTQTQRLSSRSDMATYFFSSPVDVDIRLEGEELRKQVESKAEKDHPVSCPVYYDGESVTGQVRRSCVFYFLVYSVSASLLVGSVPLTANGRSRFVFETVSARRMMESKSSLWGT